MTALILAILAKLCASGWALDTTARERNRTCDWAPCLAPNPSSQEHAPERTRPLFAPRSFCLVTLAKRSHFPFLAARLALTKALGEDRPRTVVLFDAAVDRDTFCAAYGEACDDVDAVLLEAVSTEGEYASARTALADPDPAPGAAPPHCRDSPGRVYQTYKKLRGVSSLAGVCGAVWLSDAESLPYRKFNFTRHMFARGSDTRVISSWYPNASGCSDEAEGMWRDPACGNFIAQRLGFRTPGSNGSTWDAAYLRQGAPVDQSTWYLSPETVRAFVGIIEAREGTSLGATLARNWGVAKDLMLWNLLARTLDANRGATVVNFPDAIRTHLPAAAKACCGACGCAAMFVRVLWSDCFLNAVGPRAVADFFVDKLGLWGTWWELMRPRVSVLNARDDVAWCVNNCFGPIRKLDGGGTLLDVAQRITGTEVFRDMAARDPAVAQALRWPADDARARDGGTQQPPARCDATRLHETTEGRWIRAPPPPFAELAEIEQWPPGLDGSHRAAMAGWVWEPGSCALVAFDADAFLDRLRHTHVLIVGDSITSYWFATLHALLGSARTILSGPFNSADAVGSWWNARPKLKGDFRCRTCVVGDVCYMVPYPPFANITTAWPCCRERCDTRDCCRTIRQLHIPATNTTITFHASAILADVTRRPVRAFPVVGAAPDCLLRPGPVGGDTFARCRRAPWHEHLASVDLLVFNTGHHIHNFDPEFAAYGEMVDVVLRELEARLPRTARIACRGVDSFI